MLCRAVPCCAVLASCYPQLYTTLWLHVLLHLACNLLQDVKAGTIPAEPLMQALLDQYLRRLSVNRATLGALFKAGDNDSDGLLDRPQAKAALLVVQPSMTDTLQTAIWLEREKVPWAASSPIVSRL